jgi:hypothetical protein
MTTDESHVVAIALAAFWVVSGILAFRRHRTAAVAINLLFALPVCLLAVVPLVRVVIDRETYVRQYGQAALGDLPLTAIVFALSLLAVIASLFSLRQKPWVFVVGWLANAPTLVFLIYLAFWFHIF